MPPFSLHEADTKTEKYARILECHLSFPCGLPPSFVDLASNILQPDPQKRFSITQIKSHPFFKDIDWDLVKQKKTPNELLPPITVDQSDITKNFDDFDLESQDDEFSDF